MAVPDLPICYRVFAHHDCVHNQIVSIHNRVCGKVRYDPDPQMLCKLRSFMRRVGSSLAKPTVWSLDQVANHYTGAKRERYKQAAEESRAYGLSRANSKVKMFIKCEKIKFQDAVPGKHNPDPRAIQFRDPVYAVNLATYLKPIEEIVYHMRGNRLNKLPPSRVIGKGLNQQQRAELVVEKWERFDEAVAISLDASRFDQHISVGHLKAEHAFYRAMNNSPVFAQLLSWQLVNEVTTSRGLKYITEGKRMSGDMNTALGNCVIMVCMLAMFFEDKAVCWDCIDDGDDIVLFIERRDMALLDPLLAHFTLLGMDMKVEEQAFKITDIEWCQSKPVLVGGVWKFIRNPAKVLSGALVGQKWITMQSELSRRKLANTIGMCEAILNAGVPVLQAFAHAIIRNAATKKTVSLAQTDQLIFRVRSELGKSRLRTLPSVQPAVITNEARQTFSEAFGIDIDTQIAYERYFENWAFQFSDPIAYPKPIDVTRWEWVAEDVEFC